MNSDLSLEELLSSKLQRIEYLNDIYWLIFDKKTDSFEIYQIEKLFSLLINRYEFYCKGPDDINERYSIALPLEHKALFITMDEYEQVASILEPYLKKLS